MVVQANPDSPFAKIFGCTVKPIVCATLCNLFSFLIVFIKGDLMASASPQTSSKGGSLASQNTLTHITLAPSMGRDENGLAASIKGLDDGLKVLFYVVRAYLSNFFSL